MRFAWKVQPRNLLLLSCHIFNEGVQSYQLQRKIRYEMAKKEAATTASPSPSSPSSSATTSSGTEERN
jgi:hypothetical protein